MLSSGRAGQIRRCSAKKRADDGLAFDAAGRRCPMPIASMMLRLDELQLERSS